MKRRFYSYIYFTRDWQPGNEVLISRRVKILNLAVFFKVDPGFEMFKSQRMRILENSKIGLRGLRGSNPGLLEF